MGFGTRAWATGGVALCLSAAAAASPVFEITEVYAGITGEDGTPDWIEVTNTGDMAGSTAALIYDDESLDPGAGAALADITLGAGESAVFLVTDDATAQSLVDFQAIWGSGINVQLAAGGGGLSSNGDTAALLLADGTVVDAVTFGAAANTGTIDAVGTPVTSQLGVNGAFESNAFFNDNIGGPGNSLTLVGSPGVVPEPASLALLGLGAVAVLRRRRAS